MFANTYPVGEYSLEDSQKLFRRLLDARLAGDATTNRLVDLLPPRQQELARRRYAGGGERPDVGKSVAHLRLDEADLCHAKV